LHLGAGGCGKTHNNLNDKGLVRVLFLAPSWKLARNKQNETGINCSVWARALTNDPEQISKIKESANVLIIDEISMLNEIDKQKFFSVYSDMKIIMCGDLGYQLPCIDGIEANADGFDNIVKHDKNYRCNDKRLFDILQTLRDMITKKVNKNQINKWVVSKFEELKRVISINELKQKYDIQDMLLSGTNELKDYYTNLFSGKFNQEKYYIMENNRLHSNGDIIIGEKPDKCKCEVRHCFTTHSIQGETALNKLFIDSSKMFDSRMFYTAISRAKNLDQIYIIKSEEHSFKYEYGKIYKIESRTGTYIGSTIKPLEKRLQEHKKDFEEYKKKFGKYITSFVLLSDEDVSITKIEDFKCNDLKDLWKREAEIIKQYGNKCVNKTFNEQQ